MEQFGTDRIIDLVISMVPEDMQPTGTPVEMTRTAARCAFALSTAAGLPPGPAGWATIAPEIVGLMKIQLNLACRIASWHGKDAVVHEHPELLLLILGTGAGVGLGKKFVFKLGDRVIPKVALSSTVRAVTTQLGVELSKRMARRAVGRWVPVVVAPVFGYFSLEMTRKVGMAADQIFTTDTSVQPIPNPL